jgi:hypothetical protein
MNPPTEQLIRDYLNRLSVAARGNLALADRQSLLDRTRARIEAECGGINNANAMQVRKALAGLGDPIAVVEREQAKVSTGQAGEAGELAEASDVLVAGNPGESGPGESGTVQIGPGPNGPAESGPAESSPAQGGPGQVNGVNGIPKPRPADATVADPNREVSAHEAGPSLNGTAGPGRKPRSSVATDNGTASAGETGLGYGPGGASGFASNGGASISAEPELLPAPELGDGPEPGDDLAPGKPGATSASGQKPPSGGLSDPNRPGATAQGSSTPGRTTPGAGRPVAAQPGGARPGARDGRRPAAASAAGGLGGVIATATAIVRKNPVEMLALVLLGIGGAVYPPIWLIGVLLVAPSRKWSSHHKYVGLVLPLIAIVIGTVLTLVIGGQHDSLSSYAYEAWLGAERISRVATLLGAVYLFWALRRGRREPRTPPWNVPHRLG